MITYKKGDLFDNLSKDKKNVILHVCNDAGGWGSGFVVAINNNLGMTPQSQYRKWHQDKEYNMNRVGVPFKLGQIQVSKTDKPNVFVINMIGQSCPGGHIFECNLKETYLPPIRYQSLEECLYRVQQITYGKDINLVAPKFGAGLAGGDWNTIEGIINKVGLDITIWELQ